MVDVDEIAEILPPFGRQNDEAYWIIKRTWWEWSRGPRDDRAGVVEFWPSKWCGDLVIEAPIRERSHNHLSAV
jgi:hypothetical protein